MKKTLLLTLILIAYFGFSQDKQENKKFDYIITKGVKQETYGVLDFAVLLDKDKRTAEQLYDLMYNWVQVTYENPQEVLLGQVKGEYLRIKGFASYGLSYPSIQNFGLLTPTDLKYNITFRFKTGKIKVEVDKFEYWDHPTSTTAGSWVQINSFKLTRKNGKLAKGWGASARGARNRFNALFDSMDLYVNSNIKNVEVAKDDW